MKLLKAPLLRWTPRPSGHNASFPFPSIPLGKASQVPCRMHVPEALSKGVNDSHSSTFRFFAVPELYPDWGLRGCASVYTKRGSGLHCQAKCFLQVTLADVMKFSMRRNATYRANALSPPSSNGTCCVLQEIMASYNEMDYQMNPNKKNFSGAQ